MTTLKAALDDFLNNRELSLNEAVDRHFTPDYRQRTDGEWSDQEGFVAHIAHLRDCVRSAEVTILEEFVDTNHYGERHIVDITKNDGGHVIQEVYAFGDLTEDSRFKRLEETTLMLSGAESDRNIASAR